MMSFVGKCLIRLHQCFFQETKQTQLLSRVARESNVVFETGDIFGPVIPETHDPRLDVIRASNVLNLCYFSSDQITHALKNLRAHLNEGGLLVVNRTLESQNQFTVFRFEGADFSSVLDLNQANVDCKIHKRTRKPPAFPV